MVRTRKEVVLVGGVPSAAPSTRFSSKALLMVLLVLATMVIAANAVAAVDGCYIYPEGSEDVVCQEFVSETDAQDDCAEHSSCDFTSNFYPGQSCTDPLFASICPEVLCSIDCEDHALTVCEALGGQEVPLGQESLWCSEGCCNVGTFCGFVELRSECISWADTQGIDQSLMTYLTGYTPEQCTQVECGLILDDATIQGYVLDQGGNPIVGAEVELTTTQAPEITSSTGAYSFSDVSAASYTLTASATGFAQMSITVTPTPGEVVELNFSLGSLSVTSPFFGVVVDSNGDPLQGVTLCYDGFTTACVLTNEGGEYTTQAVPLGTYTVALSKYGYTTIQDQIEIVEQIEADDNEFPFTLGQGAFQGIEGTTYLDSNDNEQLDIGTDQLIYGAKIYVNDIFRGNSQYPTGEFQISAESGEHSLYATYQDYESGLVEGLFVPTGSSVSTGSILLTRTLGECSYGQPNDEKPVAQLFATTPVGIKAVELSWEKPCPEVAYYDLYKDGVFDRSISPLQVLEVDYDVEWGAAYTYEIYAVYTDGPDGARSSTPATTSIVLGTQECEGAQQGATFCARDDPTTEQDERKLVYSCDSTNNLFVSSDCRSLDSSSSDWYCTQVQETEALCKDAGMCNVLEQFADPFGLYYTQQQCYGSFDASSGYENYCVYDYTESVVNSCEACSDILTCFDYKSEGACSINNCFGVGCKWVAGAAQEELLTLDPIYPITDETGHGFCVEEEYEEDDYCSLCSPESDLFENSFCTADVCSNLGACFSDDQLSECHSCGDEPTEVANCYSYVTELECSGFNNVDLVSGSIQASQDECSWNVCSWASGSGSPVDGVCFKDGNADSQDDCSLFAAGEYTACTLDVRAPITTLETDNQAGLSLAHPNVTFAAIDSQNPLREVWFCLDSAQAPGCTNFEAVSFPGLVFEEAVEVDLIRSSFLQSSLISGETYRLRFYSLDKYYNQEDVQDAYFFVDNQAPEFVIETAAQTAGDLTTLDVFLGSQNEPMSCDFTLTSVLPLGSSQTTYFDRSADKAHTYDAISSVIVNISVTCFDDYDNEKTLSERLVFDTESNIELVYPEYDGTVAQEEIAFAVNTLVGAHCELYALNPATLSYEKRADFISSDAENKVHETPMLSGFAEGNYPGTVRVTCVESLTNEVFEDYFYFRVDFTAPETFIILTEGTREERPLWYGWEESFIAQVQVDFECRDDGFECAATYYCLGDACETNTQSGYVLYDNSVILTNSTMICYYSEDTQSIQATPMCGTVNIDGYGIELVAPTGFYFEEELWGVSNTAIFDWELLTRVDTQSCIFDFTPNFAYDSQPLYKHLDPRPTQENHYQHLDFPGQVLEPYNQRGSTKTLYVQCKDTNNDVGPAQKMHLEYDPSAPTIRSTNAVPDPVFEGIYTNLFTTTDDKTLCRFSDNSDGLGSHEYGTMEFAFSGFDENIMFTDHETRFEFGNMLGPSKTYDLNVQCMNGAGDFSQVEELSFDVDYSAAGYIVSTAPSGFSDGAAVSLEVITNKNAVCTYDGVAFEATGATQHTQFIGELEEGEYQYLISCIISENRREAELTFIVDRTPPLITQIDDGTQTCSLDTVHLLIYSNEENITEYNYELYQGDSSSSTSSSALVSSGALPGTNGSTITGLSLDANESYYVRVLAVDGAGNWGEFATSDGFLAQESDESACVSDSSAPLIHVETNNTCSEALAELVCSDELGCASIMYGFSASASSCEANETYYGNKITFESSGWVCYTVEDVAGNVRNGSSRVTFLDDDGDGIANSCDECSRTVSGKAVDSVGCSTGQVPVSELGNDGQGNDQDGDSLPDYWEKLYDTALCELDFRIKDSSGSGIFDSDEDYDDDGYTNYEEYRAGYDPCLADAPSREDQDSDDVDVTYTDPADLVSSRDDGSNLGAWLTFLLGLVVALGSSGFLVYFYLYMPVGKRILAQAKATLGSLGVGTPSTTQFAKPFSSNTQPSVGSAPSGMKPQSLFGGLKSKIAQLHKEREIRHKQRSRKDVFAEFSTGSHEFPHFKDILRSKSAEKEKLGKLVERYKDNRADIRGGLQPHEKGLFDKLDALGKKTSGAKVSASKQDAKVIFAKLKKLSDKRKGS